MSDAVARNDGCLPVRKKSNAVERKGISFVRDAVEEANCVFKEIDRASDYGHDAFVLLVDGEEVIPLEFALQIKSGRSYCQPDSCSFHATGAQLNFWARHPLETLGVVYDPEATCSWWVDLKAEAKSAPIEEQGRTVRFEKQVWNRFDAGGFQSIVLPLLLGEPPRIDLRTAKDWLQSGSWTTHDLGARTLISRHRTAACAWFALLEAFEARGRNASFAAYRALALIMNHPEEGVLPESVTQSDRNTLRRRVMEFSESEVIELLHFVDENGFERGSAGYGLFGILPTIPDHVSMLTRISSSPDIDEEIRGHASLMLDIRANDPEWWDLWKRSVT